jgi:phosphate:Na+ symporter
MSAIAGVGGFAGGVGLYLLGQALATEGVALAGGLELRQNLARWTSGPRRALRTGAAASLLVPSSQALNAAAIGLVNTGLLGLAAALWLAIGVTAGGAMAGWATVLVGFQPWLQAAALSAIGVGALLRWSLQTSDRSAWGQVVLGMGVLMLGVHALGESFAGWHGEMRLDSWAPAGPGGSLVWILPGAAAAALLRSPSLVVVVASLAGAESAMSLPAAAFLAVGAQVGSGAAAAWTLYRRRGTAASRRVAVGQLAFLGLLTAVSLIALPIALSFLGAPRGEVAMVLLALLQTVVLALAMLTAVPLARPLLSILSELFLNDQHAPSRPDHVDSGLSAIPDLAVPALTRETGRVAAQTRELARKVLVEGGLSDLRLAAYEQATTSLAGAIEAHAGRLRRGRLPGHVSEELYSLQRAVSAVRRIFALVSSMRAESEPDSGLDQIMRSRLRQIQFSMLHLLEGLEKSRNGAARRQLEDEASAIELRAEQLEDRLLETVADGQAPPWRVKPVLDRLSRLRLMSGNARDAVRAMDTILPARQVSSAAREARDLEPAYATARSR